MPAARRTSRRAATLVARAAAMIGQDKILASPLAMAGVAATRRRRPLARSAPARRRPARARARALAAASRDTLRALMRASSPRGTGTALAGIPGDVAGKSGTAEYGGGDPPPDPRLVHRLPRRRRARRAGRERPLRRHGRRADRRPSSPRWGHAVTPGSSAVRLLRSAALNDITRRAGPGTVTSEHAVRPRPGRAGRSQDSASGSRSLSGRHSLASLDDAVHAAQRRERREAAELLDRDVLHLDLCWTRGVEAIYSSSRSPRAAGAVRAG